MKKRIMILGILAAAVLMLTACGAPKTSPENEAGKVAVSLREKVESVIPDKDSLGPLTAEDLEDVLGVTPSDYSDFIFLQSEAMDGREVLVIRAADKDAAGKLTGIAESYLERRLNETRSYAPEAYQVLSQAKVQTKNLTVALIVGPDGAKETEAILAGE